MPQFVSAVTYSVVLIPQDARPDDKHAATSPYHRHRVRVVQNRPLAVRRQVGAFSNPGRPGPIGHTLSAAQLRSGRQGDRPTDRVRARTRTQKKKVKEN